MSIMAATALSRGSENAGHHISFSDVSKDFRTASGDMTAVRDVNLAIERGQIITIIGPSGCGKSTLLNMVAGMFEPTTGSVTYDGDRVDGINTRVGYMTQNDHLLPWRTVAGNISVPLEIKGLRSSERDRRVAGLLEMVKLNGFGDNYPSQVSGGMRKRAALARLLAYDPETLLMDEPFAALDAQLRLKMQMQLREIVIRLGKTVLFVTHDLDEAAALGDRCVVFTSRPGTIATTIDIPLGRERDLMTLRSNLHYREVCAQLWALIAPEITAEAER